MRRAVRAGEWVVDLRTRTAFAAGHVAGSLNFSLADGIATYLGWLIPWGTPLTLLGENPGQVAGAQRELARIGIDRPRAAATGRPEEWAGGQPLRSFPLSRFADLEAARRHRAVVLLDVRLRGEWAQSHLAGAVHIPLHELPARLGEIPDGEVWVYCGGGHRAAIAASPDARRPGIVVAIDDEYDPRGRRRAAAGQRDHRREGGMSGWLGRLFPPRPKATAEQARQLQQQGAILLDVREDAEWRAGHAPGARHIPLSRLPARMKDLPPRRTVITVCRSGHRSARAAALLAREGREVVNLSGGMRPGPGRAAGRGRRRRPGPGGVTRWSWSPCWRAC